MTRDIGVRDEPQPVILFRPLGDLVPPGWEPGRTWQAEYHDDHRDFPLAVAWVFVPPGTVDGVADPDPARHPYVKFIFVVDDSRRRGIATRLVAAVRERWPGTRLTAGISPAGAALVRKCLLPHETRIEGHLTPAALEAVREAGVLDQMQADYEARIRTGYGPSGGPDRPPLEAGGAGTEQ